MLIAQCLALPAPWIPLAVMASLFYLWPLVTRSLFRSGVTTTGSPGRHSPLLWLLPGGVCVGLAWGGWHAERLLQTRLADECEREPLVLRGEVRGLPRAGSVGERNWQRFRLRVQHVSPARCAGPELALLTLYDGPQLRAGELWAFSVIPRVPWGNANPAGFDAAAWYAREGIDLLGSVRANTAERLRPAAGTAALHHRLRQRIADAIREAAGSERSAALLRALVVGDRGGIDDALWQQLQVWGITHLLVISGLHVALVAAGGLFLGRWLARPMLLMGWSQSSRFVPVLCGLACALGYSALAGFSVPTVRALIMAGCFMLGALLLRRGHSWRNLLLAAWLLLLLNPLQALGSGFWLSLGAVAALLWLLAWGMPRRPWCQAVRIHAFMTLAMLPLTAWWFQGGSLLGLPANLLAVPLVSLWVVPMALAGTLVHYLEPALAALMWQAATWPLQALLAFAAHAEDRGVSAAYLGLAPSATAVGCALLAAAMQALPLAPHMRLCSLVLALPLVLADRSPPPWVAELTVLDVGQGTAVVLRSRDETLVYDTGGGDPQGSNQATRSLLPFLRQQGVRRIDDLVISHADNDHSAGTGALREALPVSRIHLGENIDQVRDGQPCRAGKRWRWRSGIQFLTLTAGRPSVLSGNAASCVLLISVSGRRFLLTGDLGTEGERELVQYWGDALRADWLLVGHHGSATSSASAFLNRVQPRYAVLSHARANPFGHPHPEVLRRLRHTGAAIHSTARSGALRYAIYADGDIQVRAERHAPRPYWR
jgi:competence protein ComEC